MSSSTAAAGPPLGRSGSIPGSQRISHFRKPQCALGVLKTGYCLKLDPNAYMPKKRERFLVLTHEGLHWFKREKGIDLFGEERGSATLADIKEADMYPEEEHAFYIATTDGGKRVFFAPSKEEAVQWLRAIKTSIKSRYLYRRETLTGLSFLSTLEGEDGLVRPRLLLLTYTQAGSQQQKEVVLGRNLEYERGLALPPVQNKDQLTLTCSNGTSVTVTAGEVLAHLGSSGAGNEDKKLKATLRGIGGVPSGTLVMSATAAAQGDKAAGDKKASTEFSVLRAMLFDLLRVEHSMPLISAIFLVLVLVTGEELPQSCNALLQDRKAGAMLFVAGALALQVLLTLLRDAQHAMDHAKKLRSSAPTEEVAYGIYLEVEDCIAPQPVSAEEGVGGGSKAGAIPEVGGKPIPQRFIDGCLGDMNEAMRRWALTCEWRREFGTDDILEQPHPYFALIKECYPSYYCGMGKDGNPVYYERSGQVDQPRMRAAGCGIDQLVYHYIHMTEFCWNKLFPDETKRTITVFDVDGVGIRDLAGEAFDFLRRSSHLVQEHYPERSLVIMIVNCPGWFNVLWKMIRPMVNERTQKKVKIVGKKETYQCLLEFIDEANIPDSYGGKLKYSDKPDSCRWGSPQEVALREHVEAVNKKHGVAMIME